MNLSEPFIRRPVATSLIMSALALVGLVAFPFLPIAPLPQVDFPTIQVTATLSGASAETMASAVAAPLERQFGQIAGVTQQTSLSSLGVSQVVIQFDLNRNIDLAAQDIQAAITAASKFLPQAMTYPPIYRKVNPADAPIMMLWAHSDTLPLTTVHDNLDNIFIQALSQVPGVAQASIIGDQKPSIRVQVDPAKLASIGLTLEEVRDSLVKATSNAAKGTIFTPKVGYTISTNDQITQAEAFNNVILAYRDGAALRVRDVGEAVVEASSRYVAGFPNNKPGMLLSIKKLPGANVIDTVELIKAQLPKLAANIPAAMKVETLLDRTVTIRASVHDVEFTLVLTIGLVVMVVLLFLRDFWATFIPSITAPLALLGSFAAMFMLNFSLDNISLMGADHCGRVRGRRCHRGGGEHLPVCGGRPPALRGSAQGVARDRLHGAVDQLFAGRGVHPVIADGRDHGPGVPRVCPHGHCLHRGFGAGFADAGADAVRTLHASAHGPARSPLRLH
jgi:multidrug efflux pump subunit AcrB